MFPVFSLVLDEDVKPDMALLYPELYKDLTKVARTSSTFSGGAGWMEDIAALMAWCFSLAGPLIIF